MISKPIKLFTAWTLGPLCLLIAWALLTQPHRNMPNRPIEDNGKIQRDLAALRQLFPSEYKVVDSKIENDFISVTIEPLIVFSSRNQIKEEADKLIRMVNNVFPGKRIRIRIDKPLPNNMIKRYGSGYYDGYVNIETEAY